MSLLWARHCENCFLCSFNPHTLEAGLSFIPILLTRNPRFRHVTQSLISKPESLANCHLSSPMENALPFSLCSSRQSLVLPGHKYSGIHGGRIVLASWNLIVAEVPCASILLVLPVTEALQGPLTMVPNGQFGLKEIRGAVTEANAQGSQSSCSDSVDVKVETAARRGVIQCHLPTMLVGSCRDPERGHQGPYL